MLDSTVDRRLTALTILFPILVLGLGIQGAEAQDNETTASDALAEAAAGRIAEDLVTHWAWDPDIPVSVIDGASDLDNVLIFHVWQGRQIYYAVAANRTTGEIITPYDDDSFARIMEAEGLLSSA